MGGRVYVGGMSHVHACAHSSKAESDVARGYWNTLSAAKGFRGRRGHRHLCTAL
jgi:hypothetical protein